MGNTFTFFDQFFKTLYPNIYDLDQDDDDNEDNDNDDEEQNFNEEDHLVEDKIINITDDCKCKDCCNRKKVIKRVFSIDKTD